VRCRDTCELVNPETRRGHDCLKRTGTASKGPAVASSRTGSSSFGKETRRRATSLLTAGADGKSMSIIKVSAPPSELVGGGTLGSFFTASHRASASEAEVDN
jgi:hypothetical protein